MPRKVFTAGEVLAAADVNTYLMNQAVMTFAGTAARGSAIGTATEGMVTYLADSDSFEFFDGSSFVPLATETPTVEYLVIAGGGAGSLRAATDAAGGGGAGGYRTNVSGALSGGSTVAELPMPLVAGTYTITVGGGGAGVTADNTRGNSGSASILANIVSIGGGFGHTFANTNEDLLAGSGGGGSKANANPNGGPPVPQQGFKGGNANASFNGGAGGGGAGAVGANTIGSPGSNGGNGLASSITGSAVTRAGGGGGGGTNTSGGTGGAGGGGNGAIDAATAGNGTANTGSGGGGGETGTSGNGGSGIVIFSVPTGTSVSFSAGVTETNSTVSGRQVYVVTATSTTSETVTFA